MSEEYFIIQTISEVVKEDNQNSPIDLAAIGGVIDFSITNPVGSGAAVTVNVNGTDIQVLQPGDPMFMLGGYHNCLRRDKITFSFVGGTGVANCYYNKRMSPANCLI